MIFSMAGCAPPGSPTRTATPSNSFSEKVETAVAGARRRRDRQTFTAGQIAARIAHLPGAARMFRRGLVARDPAGLAAALGLDGGLIVGEMSRETAERVAQARRETGASHALAVLIEVDDGADSIDFGGIYLAITASDGVAPPRSRIYGRR
jgi:nicotinamide-nucleotide amidase